jgi:capsular polysaccharide biosynthesis protein
MLDVASRVVELAPQCSMAVNCAMEYTNLEGFDTAFYESMMRHVYSARDCSIDSVDLVSFPDDAILWNHFILQCGGDLIQEQFPPWFEGNRRSVDAVVSNRAPQIGFDQEVLLVARFGIDTWGHWLGELLPKVVLTERRFPGRFLYALPRHVLHDATPGLPWARIRDSLKSYDIRLSQVFELDENTVYKFGRLYGVTSIWSDHMMHPAAAEALRSIIKPLPAIAFPVGLSIARAPSAARAMANAHEIFRFLCRKGFFVDEVGSRPFSQQVEMFAAAPVIVGTLGSDLTNLIFSPPGVNVISLAPSNFGDRFFYALVLERRGRFIDLRGPVTKTHDTFHHRSEFSLNITELAEALKRLDAVTTTRATNRNVAQGGPGLTAFAELRQPTSSRSRDG